MPSWRPSYRKGWATASPARRASKWRSSTSARREWQDHVPQHALDDSRRLRLYDAVRDRRAAARRRHPQRRRRARGKRFVTASEVNEGARWNEARLKALTGGDYIPARFLHAEFFTFRPVAKFWFAVNTKPQAHDHSHGFWRRLRLIPFPCTFPIDKKLSAALMAEAAGILAWAVRGCLRWQLDGLQAPAIVTTTTDEYREDSDPLSEFLRAACVIGDTVADSEMSASDLYKHYRDWAQRNSLSEREMLTATSFGTLIKNHLAWRRGRAGLINTGVARSV